MAHGEKLVRRKTFAHRKTFTHRGVSPRSLYTKQFLHTGTFTHRSFYTQELLHTEAVARKIAMRPQCLTLSSHAKGLRLTLANSNFISVFDVPPSLRAKGRRRGTEYLHLATRLCLRHAQFPQGLTFRWTKPSCPQVGTTRASFRNMSRQKELSYNVRYNVRIYVSLSSSSSWEM